MRRLRTVLKRALLGLTVLVLLLGAAVTTLLSTTWGQRLILDEVQHYVGETYNIELRVDGFELDLLSLELMVRGVSVSGSDGEPILEVRSASVALDGGALLGGDIDITAIRVEDPRVRVVMGAAGEVVNLPEIRVPESDDDGESSMTVIVRDVRLRGGEIRVELDQLIPGEERPEYFEIQGLGIEVEGSSAATLAVRLAVEGGGLHRGEVVQELRELALRATVSSERVELERLGLHLGRLELEVNDGELQLAAPFDARAEATLALGLEMANELPFEIPRLGGELEARVQFRRQEEALDVFAALSGAEVLVDLGRGAEEQSTSPADASEARQGAAPLGDLEAAVRFTGDQLTVERLEAEVAGGRLSTERASLDLSAPGIQLDALLQLEGIDLGQLLAALGLGDVGVDLDVTGRVAARGGLAPLNLRVEANRLEARELLVEAVAGEHPQPAQGRVERLSLEGVVQVGSSSAQIERLELALGDEQTLRPALSVSGAVPYGMSPTLGLTVRTLEQGLSLEPIGRFLGQRLAGNVRLDAEVSGSYSALAARGTLGLRGFRGAGAQVDQASGSFRFRDGVVQVPELRASLGRSRVRIEEARLDLGLGDGAAARRMTGGARVHLEPVEIADVTGFVTLPERFAAARGAVRGQASVRLRGGFDAIDIEADARVSDLGIGATDLGALRVSAAYRGGAIEVERAELTAGQGQISVAGNIGRGGELAMTAEVERFDVQPLNELFDLGSEIEALLDARATISGTLDAPRGEGRIGARMTRVADVRLGDTSLRWTIDEAGLHLQGRLMGALLGIDELDLGLVEPYPLRLRGDIALRSLASFLPEGMLPLELDGAVEGEFEVAGELSRLLSLRGRVALERFEAEVAGFRLRARQSLILETREGELTLRPVSIDIAAVGEGESALGARLRLVETRLGLESPLPLRSRFRIQLFDLAELLGSERAPAGLAAIAEIEGGVVGELETISEIRARATVRRLAARQEQLLVEASQPFEISYQRNRVRLERALIDVGTNEVTPSRVTLGGWVEPEAMDLAVNGEIELATLAPLVSAVQRLEGHVSVDGRLLGSPAAPLISGGATIRDLGVRLPELPRGIEEGAGEISFSSNVISVDRFQAFVLGGFADIRGRVELENFRPSSYQLDVNLSDATYPLGSESAVTFNAALGVESPTESDPLPRISGGVEVLRLRYQDPIRLGLNVGSAVGAVGRSFEPQRTQVRTYDRDNSFVRLNIEVSERGRLNIDNNLLDATLHIDEGADVFRVVGTNQDLGVLGTIRIERESEVTFRGTDFEVSRGFLRFQRRDSIEAGLDFVATAQVRRWLVTLRATGSTSEPEISLSSDPPLDEADIILLLTVGMIQSEIQNASSTGLLFDIVTRGLDSRVEEAIPFFDEFRLTTDYSSRVGRAVPMVHVGRNLTNNLELGADTAVSGQRDFETSLVYEVLDWLTLEAIYSNDADTSWGDLGGDVRFHYEW